MQRALSVIPGRVKDLEQYADVWDNEKDMAIFAKILKENPQGSQDSASWFENILNRGLAKKELSDRGKKAMVSLRILNEGMGTVRAQSQLPSTVGSMMATMLLMPGAQTADSKMFHDQLQHVLELVQAEAGLPFYGMQNIDITHPGKGGSATTAKPKFKKNPDGSYTEQ
jgi:hypothetical protein